MRAQGVTRTDHYTSQLATTHLTDNTIDNLWAYRFRVRKWTVAGTLTRTYSSWGTNLTDLSFTGTIFNTRDSAVSAGPALERDEPMITVESGTVWSNHSSSPFTFGGSPPPAAAMNFTLTAGNVEILRPEIVVVGPGKRARLTMNYAMAWNWESSSNTVNLGTASVPPYAPGSVTATLDSRTLGGNVAAPGDAGTYVFNFTVTPLEFWAYSDGVTPIWHAGTGTQLAPTYQHPM